MQEKKIEEREAADLIKEKKVNEVCVKEWELRLKAKEYLKTIRK